MSLFFIKKNVFFIMIFVTRARVKGHFFHVHGTLQSSPIEMTEDVDVVM